jgi:hypothetical protein
MDFSQNFTAHASTFVVNYTHKFFPGPENPHNQLSFDRAAGRINSQAHPMEPVKK